MSLVSVRTFKTTWEAGMAKSILEAEGIPAFVDGETLRGLALPGRFPWDVELLVSDDVVERAREILRRWDESKKPPDESADAEDRSAPPEGSSADEPAGEEAP